MAPPTQSKTDARFVRVEQKLHSTAIALAALTPVEKLSVADVAKKAGVNRTTFYNHADSPAQLLQAALRNELDAMRAAFLETSESEIVNFRAVWTAAAHETATHVERFDPIYAHDFATANGGPISALLSQHIAESMRLLFDRRPDLLPPHDDLDSAFLRTAYSASLGAGLTAVLREWRRMGGMNVDDYVAAVLDTLPLWMLDSDGKAHPVSRRTTKESK